MLTTTNYVVGTGRLFFTVLKLDFVVIKFFPNLQNIRNLYFYILISKLPFLFYYQMINRFMTIVTNLLNYWF